MEEISKKPMLRAFKEKDLFDVKRLIDSVVNDCYPEIYPPGVVEFFLQYHSLERILENATKGCMVVVEMNGKITGTGFIRDDYIGGMYVKTAMQGKGTGALILQELLNIAGKNCITRLELDATMNTRAFYEKHGFYLVSEETQFLEDGTGLNYYRMAKDVDVSG